MNNLSLKLKITLLFWIVLTLALILPSSYFINLLKKEVRRDVIFNVQKEADIVQLVLSKQFFRNEKVDLDELIKEIGQKIKDRITYIAEDGIVIADSQVTKKRLKKLDNHATRPEIVQARSKGEGVSIRFSATLQKELIYYARHFKPDSGLPKGYLRISRPYSTIAAILSRIKTDIWSVTVFSLLISGILVYFLIYNLTKRFDALIKVARAIGQGDFSKRVYSSPGKEFDPLVQAINEMAENIEKNVETISRQKVELEAILNGMDAGGTGYLSAGEVEYFYRDKTAFFCPVRYDGGVAEGVGMVLSQQHGSRGSGGLMVDQRDAAKHLEFVDAAPVPVIIAGTVDGEPYIPCPYGGKGVDMLQTGITVLPAVDQESIVVRGILFGFYHIMICPLFVRDHDTLVDLFYAAQIHLYPLRVGLARPVRFMIPVDGFLRRTPLFIGGRRHRGR